MVMKRRGGSNPPRSIQSTLYSFTLPRDWGLRPQKSENPHNVRPKNAHYGDLRYLQRIGHANSLVLLHLFIFTSAPL